MAVLFMSLVKPLTFKNMVVLSFIIHYTIFFHGIPMLSPTQISLVTSMLTRTALALTVLLVVQGCSTFDHLTQVDHQAGIGPSATDCGSCHVDQYKEWHGSAHNTAYTDPVYQEAIDTGDDACMACHIPTSIRTEEMEVRKDNLHDGVSCVACHLEAGSMYGPHESSALVNPHPVTADPSFYASAALCGKCHEETFDSWQNVQKKHEMKSIPTCQQCHMPSVTRTSTKGTNMFSSLLVYFEESHEVRSHRIELSVLKNFPDAIGLAVSSPAGKPVVITVQNKLPHNLPAGEYTESTCELTLLPDKSSSHPAPVVPTLISDPGTPLLPGDSRTFPLTADSRGNSFSEQATYSIQVSCRQPSNKHLLQLASKTMLSIPASGTAQ